MKQFKVTVLITLDEPCGVISEEKVLNWFVDAIHNDVIMVPGENLDSIEVEEVVH